MEQAIVTEKEMLISALCIKRYFPDDMGGAQALKRMHQEEMIKPARIKTMKMVTNTIAGQQSGNVKIKFFRISKVEKEIDRALSGQSKYFATTETRIKFKRLKEVIELMKKDKDNKDIEWK
jgi:hypothetical protein